MCYQSVCYSASIVDFECQSIIVKQPLLAIVITKPLITIVATALFRSGSLVEFDLKSGKAQKEISILFFIILQICSEKTFSIGIYLLASWNRD